MARNAPEAGEPRYDAAGCASSGLELQKKSLSASERDETQRQAWREHAQDWEGADLVFLDESGCHISFTPLYGWAPRHQRATGSVPRNRGQNITVLAALGASGVQVAMTLEGAADGLAFEVFIEKFLVPTLRPGQIVVLDNLNVHKNAKARAAVDAAGCRWEFLPPYSPDLNPIELMWSKLKAHLRREGARKRELLETAIGTGLNQVSAQEAQAWFIHCGYRFGAQPY